jgi:hypothetical protein
MIGIFIVRLLAASLIAFCTLMSAEYRTSTQASQLEKMSCRAHSTIDAVRDLRMLAQLMNGVRSLNLHA